MHYSMELMAPAGSYEAIEAAIKAGAQSIYFGVEQLNMRTKSTHNFTLEDLPEIARRCQENQLKSYLTLNTILYDHDINLMKNVVDAAKEAKISAIIASDLAVMNYCKKIGVTVHISTQANISNIDTIEFYAQYADVVVLARELSLIQVAHINKEIKKRDLRGPSGELIRTEIFGHGALCMAVSGKCYLSLHSHFSSANRGACVQNCRKGYIVTDKEDGTEYEIDNEYIMSAADLCTVDFLDKIAEAGVSVLKIEGRGRSADYVYVTTQVYREAIDALEMGAYTPALFADWRDRLATVYNRGFWDGYYLGRKLGQWSEIPGSKASKRKIYLAKGETYYSQKQIAEFSMESNELRLGDEIVITGPTTGVIMHKIEQLFADGKEVESAQKGQTVTFKLPEKVRPSDKLYKWVDSAI